MKLIKTFLLNSIILTITALILRCVGMFFNAYISQKIGAEALGLYGLVMSIYGFAITIALSGISLATTKIVASQIAIGNIGNVKNVVRKCMLFSLFFSTISSILLIIMAPFICKNYLHDRVTILPFHIISISLPFISMSSCLTGYFSAIRNTVKPASNQVFEQLLKVFLISFLLKRFMPCGLEYICISLILGNIVSEILSFFQIYILYKLDNKKYVKYHPTGSRFERRILQITIPVGFTSFIRSGLSTIKQILIPWGFEKKGGSYKQALSSYGLISGMAMPLVLFPNVVILTVSNLLIPEFTEFNVRGEHARIRRVTKKILKYSLIFSLIVSMVLFMFASKISYVVYKSTEVVLYIRVLAPLIPIMYIDSIVDAILKGLDKQVTVLKINILDLLTSIVLIVTAIPKFGVTGYIVVIYFSELLNFFFSYRALSKTIN